jgi:hypothetical protein
MAPRVGYPKQSHSDKPTKKRRDVNDFKADLAAKKQAEAPTEANSSIEFHPIADWFPLLEGETFDELVRDVSTNGLIHPIIKFEGKILDGRNRYRACLASGVAPIFQNFSGTDPVAYVLSANIHRRHLTNEQRLRLVDEVIKAKPDLSSRQVAKQTKVSTTTAVKRRKKLEASGDVSTVDTSTDTKGRKQPRRKSTAAKSKPTAEPASDIRSKCTVRNGQSRDEAHVLRLVAMDPPPDPLIKPTAPSCSGSSTTSAAETAVRILIELLAHGIKADPEKVAELLREKKAEQIDPLIDWLKQLGTAVATGGAS